MSHDDGPPLPILGAVGADHMLTVLASAAIFRSLRSDELARLATLGRRRVFPSGELLMRQGEASDCLHAILRGRVRVERTRSDRRAPLFVAELGPGETVGEMGLLNHAPRSATVTALEDTETLELDAAAVAMILAEFPDVSTELLRTLSARLRGTTVLSALRIVHDALTRERAQAAAREEAAHLQGVLLAARTMEHHINNQLSLAVGYGELLADDPRLPSDLRERVQLVVDGTRSAAETVQKFQRIAEIRLDTSLGTDALLRLD
jgi:CRP-like cAMP-binding protein